MVTDIQATTKTCSKCKTEKPFVDYYKSKGGKHGLFSKCKECYLALCRKYRAENRDHYNRLTRNRQRKDYGPEKSAKQRAYIHKLRQTPEGREMIRGWYKTYNDKSAGKLAARSILNNAIKAGKVSSPGECSICGESGPVEGHHEDYTKPLDVVWVCVACHRFKHRKD